MRDRLIQFWIRERIVRDRRLIKAFEEVSREKFIHDEYMDEAYGDYPLPIGHGQTISQPSTIMIMIEAIEPQHSDKVLEVGTGSGYNAALISRLVKKVYTTEIIPELVEFAKKNLEKAKIKNVEVIQGDGSQGYGKEKPYDKIIVTAACPRIPEPLVKQLKEGGIIIAPVGDLYGQKMIKGVKREGKLETRSLGHFMFVPLKGKHGY
jgi:protein-L-isoaspartate(D-aspartate) O-methyltransferase